MRTVAGDGQRRKAVMRRLRSLARPPILDMWFRTLNSFGVVSNLQCAWPSTWIDPIPNAPPRIDGWLRRLARGCRCVYRGSTALKRIALTFDVGYAEEVSPLLDILRAHEVTATFFVCGRWVARNPQTFRDVISQGHLVGNHSYSHQNLVTLSLRQLVHEARKTDRLIVQWGGRPPTFFRPPFGYFSERVLRALCAMGYRTVFWGISMRDWEPMSQEQLIRGVIDYLHNGAIALLHVTPDGVRALDSSLREINARGYEVVPLDELVDDEAPG